MHILGKNDEPTSERPSNESIVNFVKEQAALQGAESLAEQISEGGEAAADLENKRRIVIRAFEITIDQLSRDAAEIERKIHAGGVEPRKMYDMVELGMSMRHIQSYLTAIITPNTGN